MKLDALGNPVVIGNRYGIATNTNGITRVVVGKILRETERGVTLEVETYRHFVYGDLTDKIERDRKTISCLGCNLFPVS